MKKNLISTLLLQHSTLLGTISKVREMSEKVEPSYTDIEVELKKIGKLLVEHLYLENKLIYKNIYENPRSDLASILSAQSLFEEMILIRKRAIAFLKAYNDKDKIRNDFEDFKIRLEETDKNIRTRIRIEEDGLFKFYENH